MNWKLIKEQLIQFLKDELSKTGLKKVTVGISELKEETLKVYPNPFIEKVELEWGRNIKNGSINLFDIYGRLVFNESKVSGNSYLLRRNELAKGVYFVEVKDGNQFSWAEILIAK